MAEPTRDQVLDHEYDGIQEYDNRLPNWWLYTLYGSIVFAVLYWLYLHTWGVGLQQEVHYEEEMRDAERMQATAAASGPELTNESLLALTKDAATYLKGRFPDRPFLVTVSVDPLRDTPEVMADYVASFHPDFHHRLRHT